MKFDLEERTLKFAKDCLTLCKFLAKDTINSPLISQLVRASSSVGANYREANNSITRREFFHRIGICRKEATETKYWLELTLHNNPKHSDKISLLLDESSQLARIFAAISVKNSRLDIKI